jgi:hypothetical protein
MPWDKTGGLDRVSSLYTYDHLKQIARYNKLPNRSNYKTKGALAQAMWDAHLLQDLAREDRRAGVVPNRVGSFAGKYGIHADYRNQDKYEANQAKAKLGPGVVRDGIGKCPHCGSPNRTIDGLCARRTCQSRQCYQHRGNNADPGSPHVVIPEEEQHLDRAKTHVEKGESSKSKGPKKPKPKKRHVFSDTDDNLPAFAKKKPSEHVFKVPLPMAKRSLPATPGQKEAGPEVLRKSKKRYLPSGRPTAGPLGSRRKSAKKS